MRKNKYKKVSGFVMNKKTGHPSYAYRQNRNIVSSLGFTHNENDIAPKKKLHKNIDPYDDRDCYVKYRAEYYKSNFYKQSSKYKDYKFYEKDKPFIDGLIKSNSYKNKKKR